MKAVWSAPAERQHEEDKLRLVMMHCMYFGLNSKQRTKMAAKAGLLTSSLEVINKVAQIVPPWLPNDRKKKRPKPKSDEDRPYDLSRWKPRLNDLFGAFLESTLPTKEFP